MAAKLFRGEELQTHNAAIQARYPKVCNILQWVLCCYCVHRGKYRGCSFGVVPLTLDNKSCPIFRAWSPWQTEQLKKEAQEKLVCTEPCQFRTGKKS